MNDLRDNHLGGLEMDNLDQSQMVETRKAMARVAASPEKLLRYCMNAAGYWRNYVGH